jgi:hypothetical protein
MKNLACKLGIHSFPKTSNKNVRLVCSNCGKVKTITGKRDFDLSRSFEPYHGQYSKNSLSVPDRTPSRIDFDTSRKFEGYRGEYSKKISTSSITKSKQRDFDTSRRFEGYRGEYDKK